MSKIIELRDLLFSYGREFELSIDEFSANEGEFIGIIGPNGSGKSTLLRLLARLEKANSGQIKIGNLASGDWSNKDFAGIVSYVPQYITSYLDFTVREIIDMGLYYQAGTIFRRSASANQIIENSLKECSLKKIADKKYFSLSGGEKQRVFIAKALAQNSSIILLDEPVSNLDIFHKLEICNLLRKLNNKNKTIIIVLHDINLAARYCTRLLLLDNGQVVASGTPEQIITPDFIEQVYNIDAEISMNKFSNKPFIEYCRSRADETPSG